MDNRFDVIASGALLGINYKEVDSFLMGYTEQFEMHSLDFEEFLWANGVSKEGIGYVKEYFDKKELVSLAMHDKTNNSLFKTKILK